MHAYGIHMQRKTGLSPRTDIHPSFSAPNFTSRLRFAFLHTQNQLSHPFVKFRWWQVICEICASHLFLFLGRWVFCFQSFSSSLQPLHRMAFDFRGFLFLLCMHELSRGIYAWPSDPSSSSITATHKNINSKFLERFCEKPWKKLADVLSIFHIDRVVPLLRGISRGQDGNGQPLLGRDDTY